MDQELSAWLHEHQAAVQEHWWAAAREAGTVSEKALDGLSQKSASGTGSFCQRLLASLTADGPPDPQWVDTQVRNLSQSDLLALISALRLALFEAVFEQTGPQEAMKRWRQLRQRVDRVGLALAQACDSRLVGLDAEREHWQTLYNLTRELSTSIDLSYVLQNAMGRILHVLDAPRGAVLLLDPGTNSVTLRAAQDWHDVSLSLCDLPSDWQRGYGEPCLLTADDGHASALDVLLRGKSETVIAAPLLSNGQFHGILTVATPNSNGFGPQQLDLIDAVVNSIASNVGSSEVIGTLSDQARELGQLLRQQQEENSKRESILASIADGVVYNDRHGRILLVNRAAELILSTPASDLVGRELNDLFDLFTAGPRRDMVKAMMTILADPTVEISPDAAQTALQIEDLVINAHLASVVTEQGEFLGIVTVFRDITREVEADRAKSEFVSTVSHELRTPMTAIKGYTDLIYSGMVGEINDNQKRFLSIIKNNTDRLTALINDLLDISRVETGRVRFEPEPVQLDNIVKNVIDALAANAESREHSLTFRVEAGLPQIMADPDRLNQVFTNLVGNALSYTPRGGEINVEVYRVQGAIRADVRDNGIGIETEDLSKIFERFYRADHPLVQESRGTGLGLPIVKMFVEMHGGRVWAESDVGRGSTFTVILPLPTAEHEEGMDLVIPEAALRSRLRHVLVADDDPDIAELLRLHLEEMGYRATVVGRGVKVLEVARRHRPDLIVLDILLPDIDGRAVLETLKSEPRTADIPVLILTVVADDGTAFGLGAAGYLNKPIDRAQLEAAISAALSRRGRILLVEDDIDTSEMMRIALRRVGYNVDIAADGYEALTLARRWQPQAIVLDLRLPGMDGYEALTHLKRNYDTQDIPIIVISAHVADQDKEVKRLVAMGVQSFLIKPFIVSQLVREIDQVIAADQTLEEGV